MKIDIDDIADFTEQLGISEKERIGLIKELIDSLDDDRSIKEIYKYMKDTYDYETAPVD